MPAATTNDSGVAVFPLPPVTQAGTHRFEVVGSGGSAFPGRPTVTLTIRAGDPGRLRVTPGLHHVGRERVTIVATVTDSLGNPLGREPVELTSGVGAPVFVPTDSAGRSSFVLAPGALPRGGTLQLRVRKLAAVEVPVADAAGLSGARPGLLRPRRGGAGRNDPARGVGLPRAYGARRRPGRARRAISRGERARGTGFGAVLDSTGRVPLECGARLARRGSAGVRVDRLRREALVVPDRSRTDRDAGDGAQWTGRHGPSVSVCPWRRHSCFASARATVSATRRRSMPSTQMLRTSSERSLPGGSATWKS